MLKRCIYCDRDKPGDEFSQEHLLPERLGGKLSSGLFKTRDVCAKCNNIAGLFIDGAFVKSSLFKNDAATSAELKEYIDPREAGTIQPLAYLGILDGFATQADEICELWLGPCGVQYFHMHRRDNPRWDSFAGGDPIARHRDPGRVFLLLTTAQPDWVRLALRSGMEQFSDARRYGANIALTTKPGAVEYLVQMDAAAKAEAGRILALPAQKQMLHPVDTGFDQRFMSKLALGLGFNIFGSAFLKTPYVSKLRGFMQAKSPQERVQFNLRGVNYFEGGKDVTSKEIAFPGGYTIRIMEVKDELVLSLNLPSSRAIHLVMSDEPSLWRGGSFPQYQFGTVFVAVPQVGRFAGPFKLADYFAHRKGQLTIEGLKAIEMLRVNQATLPPCF